MKIGELARATATPVETIRYYEREGLLPEPARTEANYRMYDEAHVQRLGFIRHCRCLDMTLEEIRVLLRYKDAPDADCGPVDELLDAHIEHVVARVAQLKALEKELRALRSSCTQRRPASECGILGGIERGAREHDHAAQGATHHLAGSHGRGGRSG